MISVEHMDELITRFESGELDIRDVIEQSYFEGIADALQKVEEEHKRRNKEGCACPHLDDDVRCEECVIDKVRNLYQVSE